MLHSVSPTGYRSTLSNWMWEIYCFVYTIVSHCLTINKWKNKQNIHAPVCGLVVVGGNIVLCGEVKTKRFFFQLFLGFLPSPLTHSVNADDSYSQLTDALPPTARKLSFKWLLVEHCVWRIVEFICFNMWTSPMGARTCACFWFFLHISLFTMR